MNEDPLSIIKRFSDVEKKLASEIFLAPYVPGGKITVKLNGVIYSTTVIEEGPLAEAPGFGLFQITEPGKARYAERPTREQIDAYMTMMPRVSLTLVEEFDAHWWGAQSQSSDTRFQLKDPVPVQLVERPASFQEVYARFDGQTFWYQNENRRRDPKVARALRDALAADILPDEVRVPGATPSEMFVYRIIFFARHPELAPIETAPASPIIETGSPEDVCQDAYAFDQSPHWHRWANSDLERLRKALAHAGARLDGYWKTDSNEMTVRYVIDGQTHTANVRPHDLTVTSSGICLSGRDQDFDLASLVGVMREFYRNENY